MSSSWDRRSTSPWSCLLESTCASTKCSCVLSVHTWELALINSWKAMEGKASSVAGKRQVVYEAQGYFNVMCPHDEGVCVDGCPHDEGVCVDVCSRSKASSHHCTWDNSAFIFSSLSTSAARSWFFDARLVLTEAKCLWRVTRVFVPHPCSHLIPLTC